MMQIEIQTVNNNGFEKYDLEFNLNQTIGDIKTYLIQNHNLNPNNIQLLYHVNSGLIFTDSTSINECIQNINISLNDKLSLNLAQIYQSNNKDNDNKDNNDNDNKDNVFQLFSYESRINNLNNEIKQYRQRILDLENILSQNTATATATAPAPAPPPPPPMNSDDNNPIIDIQSQIQMELSEEARLRLENEIHVQKRRQSRVMIVKSKISSEIQRGPRKIIEYSEDSPFWWLQCRESENRIKKLSWRLNQLCDMILDLCSITITFSEHCNKINNVISKSWEDIEQQYSSDILSLNAQFNELGEQFNHMSSASKQLAVTLKAVLVDAFRDFSQKHLNDITSSSKILHSLEKEYENALRKLLHSPKNLPKINPKKNKPNKIRKKSSSKLNKNNNNQSKKSFFSSEKITDLADYNLWKKKTSELKKNYELKRFEHCWKLNSVINRHRYELILNLCACFSGFETFFHVGYEASLAHKVFHRSIQMGVAQKTNQENKNDKILNKYKKELINILNTGKDYYIEKKKEKLLKMKLLKIKEDKDKADKDKADKDKDTDDDSDTDDDDDDEYDPYNVDYYSGYLWKQSSNMKKDWKRRWFVLENGELGYYRSRDKLDREFVVNTMLCKVKEKFDADYRFVFELISPSRRVYILQAQNEDDFIAWCSVLRNQVHRLLRQNTIMNGIGGKKHLNLNINNTDADGDNLTTNKLVTLNNEPGSNISHLLEIRHLKHEYKKKIKDNNKTCADCGKKDPEWVSINCGVIICIGCCGIHRGLGTHISKVRSLVLDDIPISTLKTIYLLGGNTLINKILEHTIPSDYNKINSLSSSNEREKYIKGKYMFKMFINPDYNKLYNHQQINNNLYKSAQNNELLGMFEAFCYGANIDYQFNNYLNKTVLHETCKLNYVEATEFLLQNGASQTIEDDNTLIARDIAEKNQSNDVLNVLDLHVGFDTQRKKKKLKQNISNDNDDNFGDKGPGFQD